MNRCCRSRGYLGPSALVVLVVACAAHPKPEPLPDALLFRLDWIGPADLDLHVQTPLAEEIWFTDPKSASGGVLDADCNVKPEEPCPRPRETVSWPAGNAPAGTYYYWVRLMHPREAPLPVSFTVLVSQHGKVAAEQHGQLGKPGDVSPKWGLICAGPE